MNTTRFQSDGIIVLNNRDFNIDQNNRDHHFVHNRAALLPLFQEASLRGKYVHLHKSFPRRGAIATPSPSSFSSAALGESTRGHSMVSAL